MSQEKSQEGNKDDKAASDNEAATDKGAPVGKESTVSGATGCESVVGAETVTGDGSANCANTATGNDSTLSTDTDIGQPTSVTTNAVDDQTCLKESQVKESSKNDNGNSDKLYSDSKSEKEQGKMETSDSSYKLSKHSELRNIPSNTCDTMVEVHHKETSISDKNVSSESAANESLDKTVEHGASEDDSSNVDTDVNIDSTESDTGDSQDSGKMVKLMLDSMVKSVQTTANENDKNNDNKHAKQQDDVKDIDSAALKADAVKESEIKFKPESKNTETESNTESKTFSDEGKQITDDSISKSTERAYEVLAMWNKISDSADAGSEVLCDLIAQKIKDSKKHGTVEICNEGVQTEVTESIKSNETLKTSECVQNTCDSKSELKSDRKPMPTDESTNMDMSLQNQNLCKATEQKSDESSKLPNVNKEEIVSLPEKELVKSDKTVTVHQQFPEEVSKSDERKNVFEAISNLSALQSLSESTTIQPADSDERNFGSEESTLSVGSTKASPELDIAATGNRSPEKIGEEAKSNITAKETPVLSKPAQNVESLEGGTNKTPVIEKVSTNVKQTEASITLTETPKTDHAISTTESAQNKSGPQTTETESKQAQRQKPLVIDLDDPSSPVKSQKPVERTPVKQVRPVSSGSKASPRVTGSPAAVKSPQTPGGKQSFIDNLIATGIPIVIPDDDDEEESIETPHGMPKARSNIFKMKTQHQYQTPSLKSPDLYSQQRMYNDPPAYSPTQTGTYSNDQVGQLHSIVPRQAGQTEKYSVSQKQYQSEAYMKTQPSGTMRQYPQQMSPSQSQIVGSSPQRRSIPGQMASPLPSPSHTVPSSPRNPNRRVSFSPTSNVYPINPNTPPKSMLQQGFVTPTKTPTNPVMSPRMMRAANPNQMAHVRRNIGSPQQVMRQVRPVARPQGPIVIDDDPPQHPRNDAPVRQRPAQAPQGTTRPRPNPVQQLPPKPITISAAPTPVAQRPTTIPEHVEIQAPPIMPIITNVTSMAKDAIADAPSNPPILQQADPIPRSPIVERRVSQTESLPGSFVQQANERTPVKRSRSEESTLTSPQEEPVSKRQNTKEAVTLPVTVSSAPPPPPPVSSSGTESVTGSDVVISSTEMISPSKLPPEVVIDIDVDDKSLVRRQLNIEAGQITTATSPLHSPTGSVSSMESESSTGGATTSKRGRPRAGSEKNLSCDECGKTFSTKAAVAAHFKTHSDNKPFECDVCGKHFINKGNLKKHIYTHFKEKQDK